MKKNLLLAACLCCLCLTATQRVRAQYVPTPENLEARKQFEGFRFGIFLHWGIYSEFAQGGISTPASSTKTSMPRRPPASIPCGSMPRSG